MARKLHNILSEKTIPFMKKYIVFLLVFSVVSCFYFNIQAQKGLDEKIEILKLKLSKAPKNPELHYELGGLYATSKGYYYRNLAEFHLKNALKYGNNSLKYLNSYAYLKLESKYYSEACYYFRRIVDTNAHYKPALLGILEIFKETGSKESLELLLEKNRYETLSSTDKNVFIEALIHFNKTGTAREVIEKSAHNQNDDGRKDFYLSQLYLKENDIQAFCTHDMSSIRKFRDEHLLNKIIIELSGLLTGEELIALDSTGTGKGEKLFDILNRKDPDLSTGINEAVIDYLTTPAYKTALRERLESKIRHTASPVPVKKAVRNKKNNERLPEISDKNPVSNPLELIEKHYKEGNYKEALQILNILKNLRNPGQDMKEKTLVYLYLIHYNRHDITEAENYAASIIELLPFNVDYTEIMNNDERGFFNQFRNNNFVEIEINTEPDNAMVYINGEQRGITPGRIFVPVNRRIQLDLCKNNFKSKTLQFTTEKENHLKINETLEAKEGNTTLSINSSVEDVTIYKNNSYIGMTPYFSNNSPPGYYTFTFEKEGYRTLEKLIFVKPQENNEIDVTLKKVEDYITYSELIPGLGQIVAGHEIRGGIFMLSFTGYILMYRHNVPDKPQLFDYVNPGLSVKTLPDGNYAYYDGKSIITMQKYYEEIEKIRRSEKSKRDFDHYQRQRNRFLFSGFCLYVLNILDVVHINKMKEKKERIKFEIIPVADETQTGIKLAYYF